MTCLGTIQSNRKGLPRSFTSVEGREVGDYVVLYEEGSHISIHSEVFKNKSGIYSISFSSKLVISVVEPVDFSSSSAPALRGRKIRLELLGSNKGKKIDLGPAPMK